MLSKEFVFINVVVLTTIPFLILFAFFWFVRKMNRIQRLLEAILLETMDIRKQTMPLPEINIPLQEDLVNNQEELKKTVQ